MPASDADAIRAIAAKLEPSLSNSFLKAIDRIQKGIKSAALQEALERGSLAAALSALKAAEIPKQLTEAVKVVTKVFEEAGAETIAQLTKTVKVTTRVPIPKAIESEVKEIAQRLRRHVGYFRSASIVGSWAERSPLRLPDRRGPGTSDINLILEPSYDPGQYQILRAIAKTLSDEPLSTGRLLRVQIGAVSEGAKFIAVPVHHLTYPAHADIVFDIMNPLAADAAAMTAAKLVTRVSEETRAGIRALIERSFADGVPPRATARLIKTMVGLTERQAHAVMNARAAWEQAGLTGEKLEKKLARYRDKLLRWRARNIARTESINSAVQGQLAAWRQAANQGLIQQDRTQRVWSTAPDERACPLCTALDGQAVAFNAPFTSGGWEGMGPTRHPSCRCSVYLKFTKTRGVTAPQETPPLEFSAKELADVANKLTEDTTAGSKAARASVKRDIVADLRARMKKAGVEADADQVATLLNQWAITSGDSDPESIALQIAVKEEFGLPDATLAHFSSSAKKEGYQSYEAKRERLRAFVRAQYEATQEWLAAHGIQYVTLVRGATYTVARTREGIEEFFFQAASSFSVDIPTAVRFAGEPPEGVVHMIRVPAAEVLSTARTGIGCLPEREIVVVGGPKKGYTFKAEATHAKTIQKIKKALGLR
jgi:hypothetical protein